MEQAPETITPRRSTVRERMARRDWHVPAGIAIMLLLVSLVLAQYVAQRGLVTLVEQIDQRATAAECVDLLEASFDRAVADLLVEVVDPGEANDAQIDAAERAVAATRDDAIRACYALAN